MSDIDNQEDAPDKAALELDGFIEDAEAAANLDLTAALADRNANADKDSQLDAEASNGDGGESSDSDDGAAREPDADTPLSLSLDGGEDESDGPPDVELAANLIENGGKFDEKMVEQLKKGGWSQRQIKAQEKALVLEIKSQVAELQHLAGGPDSWREIQSWAKKSLKPGQMDVFNKQLSDEDPDVRKTAVELLKTRYEVSTGKRVSAQIDGRPRGRGDQNPVSKIKDFDHYHQLTVDPRYNAFTKEGQLYTKYVEERLAEWSMENV